MMALAMLPPPMKAMVSSLAKVDAVFMGGLDRGLPESAGGGFSQFRCLGPAAGFPGVRAGGFAIVC
jgi:hypothetical protein